MGYLGERTIDRLDLIFGSPFPHRTPLSFGEPLIRCSLLIVASWLPTSAASAAFSAFPALVGALWPATRLIDIQLAAVELSTIQFGDRVVRISRAGHLHEKQTRAVGANNGRLRYLRDRPDHKLRTTGAARLHWSCSQGSNEDVLHVDALS